MKESQVGVHKGVREAFLERVCVGIREREREFVWVGKEKEIYMDEVYMDMSRKKKRCTLKEFVKVGR